MAMKQILFLTAFGMAAALKPNFVEEPMMTSLFLEGRLDMAAAAAKLAKSKVMPAGNFSCNGLNLTKAFEDVYGNPGQWMATHGLTYICASTPNESPDFAYVLYSLNGTTAGANFEYTKQDCQTVSYGGGPVGACNVVGNHCPECANPHPLGLLGTVSIQRNKVYTSGVHTGFNCNYVPTCQPQP
eukprot:TRINITY_DN751_c0_g1_i1.p1 TRINITY_DN751_c0_g1~~TRINITY_DN751_c0_g1_i1.p1  ORF type:complete len:212 (+),score=32.79 TRINITY_DN751_c0_g1_i1:84-638(+)